MAQRLHGAPWKSSENLMCSSHILACINMKIGTHIDLIEPNNFAPHVMGSAQQEFGYSIVFLRILFLTIRAFLGALTWSKTLENLHTHWNPRKLGRRRGWDPGVAQRLYGAPWNTIRKLMNSSHILALIHMKLGTHIDLIELIEHSFFLSLKEKSLSLI